MDNIYKKVIEFQEQGIPAALVTVISTKGSTPRGVGSKMIVLSDGSIIGTIGGSSVEALIIEESKSCIQSGKCDKVTHNLDDAEKEDTGMICGGVMEFFIEPLVPSFHIYIFGGGHVALPFARMATQVGFTYTIIEDRAEFATRDRFRDAKELLVGNLQEVAQKIDFKATDFVVIVTRSHDQDYLALREVLQKTIRYIGVIASTAKKKQIFSRLREEGFSQDLINTIHTPIGLDINAETPQEIAVSILAESRNCGEYSC
jgi:xanthine dehydrogenase accessory factor